MEIKKITKTETLYIDQCPICKKAIRGYSKNQVLSRMEMHQLKHKNIERKEEENQ